jgi:hypothetical protein
VRYAWFHGPADAFRPRESALSAVADHPRPNRLPVSHSFRAPRGPRLIVGVEALSRLHVAGLERIDAGVGVVVEVLVAHGAPFASNRVSTVLTDPSCACPLPAPMARHRPFVRAGGCERSGQATGALGRSSHLEARAHGDLPPAGRHAGPRSADQIVSLDLIRGGDRGARALSAPALQGPSAAGSRDTRGAASTTRAGSSA